MLAFYQMGFMTLECSLFSYLCAEIECVSHKFYQLEILTTLLIGEINVAFPCTNGDRYVSVYKVTSIIDVALNDKASLE